MHKHAAECVCVCVCVCVCAYTSTWEWQTLTPLFLYDTAYVEHQRIPCRAGSNSLIAMWRKFDWVDIVPIQERNQSGKARAEAAAQTLGQTICNGRYTKGKRWGVHGQAVLVPKKRQWRVCSSKCTGRLKAGIVSKESVKLPPRKLQEGVLLARAEKPSADGSDRARVLFGASAEIAKAAPACALRCRKNACVPRQHHVARRRLAHHGL